MLDVTPMGGLFLAVQLALAPPAPIPPQAGPPPADDLAAETPMPAWVSEGGSSAHASTEDVHQSNASMRRAAKTTIAGGAIAVLGAAAVLAGTPLFVLPARQLEKLREDNDGVLPAGDPKRQRAIAMTEAAPIVMGAGAGLLVVGAVIAIVAGRRFKRLREEKRTRTVAFTPALGPRGFGFTAQVRF